MLYRYIPAMISRICAKQIDTNSLNQPLLLAIYARTSHFPSSSSFSLSSLPLFLEKLSIHHSPNPKILLDFPQVEDRALEIVASTPRRVVFPGEKVEKRNRRRERDCSPPEKNSQGKERKEEDRCDVWRVVSGRQLRVAGGSKNLWRKLSAPVTAHCCQGNQTKRRDN